MAGLLYYVPGISTINEKKIVELGLGYATDGGGPEYAAMSPGPDGGAGVVFSLPGGEGEQAAPSQSGSYTFEQIPQAAEWIGFDKDHPPTPEDLARKDHIPGHDVRLADGNLWHVAVARAIGGTTPLPCRLKWDGAEWTPGDVMPQYKELFSEACRVWDKLGSNAEVAFSDECNVAVKALAINYRIGPAEVSLLGLFDTASETEVAKALLDMPAFEAFKKKQAAEETTLPPGEQD